MGLFSKKVKTATLVAPIDGRLIPLESVNDQVFSKKMMGDGFAIDPKDSNVVSPIGGKISSIFPTKHALMITSEEGLEIMLHLGLDTVELDGKPFAVSVKNGQQVTAGQKLATMDLNLIKQSQKEPTVITVISNMDKVKKLSPVIESEVSAGIGIMTVTL